MIETLSGLPANVVGIVVKGRLTQGDCSQILTPALQRSLKWHYKLRLYYEIRSRFPGAAWEEISLGLDSAPQWERVAIVTDVAWIKHTVQALRLLMPYQIRVFAASQIPEGLAWITGASDREHALRAARAATAPAADGRSFRPPVQYLHHAV